LISEIYFSLFPPHSLYPDTSRMSRYIKPLAAQMSTSKDLKELKELIDGKQKAFEKASQGVKQALETVELNNQWKLNMYMDLSRRLNQMRARQFDFTLEDDDEAEDETSKEAETTTSKEAETTTTVENI
jgi:hypothetical protein